MRGAFGLSPMFAPAALVASVMLVAGQPSAFAKNGGGGGGPGNGVAVGAALGGHGAAGLGGGPGRGAEGGGAGDGGGAAASTAAGGGVSSAAAGAGARDALFAQDAFLQSAVATRAAPGVAEHERVRVISVFTDEKGRPCRVMEQRVSISGQQVKAIGTICRGADGRWALSF